MACPPCPIENTRHSSWYHHFFKPMAPTPIPCKLMEHLRFEASTLQTKIIWCFSPTQITYVCTSSTPNWYAHAKQSKNLLAFQI
jgi:hypothetical protein